MPHDRLDLDERDVRIRREPGRRRVSQIVQGPIGAQQRIRSFQDLTHRRVRQRTFGPAQGTPDRRSILWRSGLAEIAGQIHERVRGRRDRLAKP